MTDELVERVMQRCEEGSVSVRTLFHDDIYAGKRTLLRAGKPRSSHAAQREEKALHERTRH
ncbi:hypothetical protein ACNRDG_16655 [Ralstonia pseudosolanacearum]|uniref:hypothetical protein n=1 Tax=Ralstonia pseudosolanacearum TaxID=1310165 RepID=UPI003AAE3E79